jgi:hypothetical protein
MAENDSRETEFFLLALILAALAVLLWNRLKRIPASSSQGGGSGSGSGGCGCGGSTTALPLGTNSFEAQMAGYNGSVPSSVSFAQAQGS